MKRYRLSIALALIAASSLLSLLSRMLPSDLLLWLRLSCCLAALVLSIQEVATQFSKKNRNSP